ncbi:MAG: hypothetical protein KBC17_02770 [Candidatus Pacebacteria bacterium]|nr:hypothetical protein [Candidatus Paceibacterota bacterium]
MKKLILAVFAIATTGAATAQNGFKTTGPIDATAKKIGVTISYPNQKKWSNGGKTVEVTYSGFDTINQTPQDFVVTSGSVQLPSQSTPTGYEVHAPGIVSEGSTTISGANSIVATGNTIIITRWLKKEEAEGMPLKTVYTVTREKMTRESTYESGAPEVEQVLP